MGRNCHRLIKKYENKQGKNISYRQPIVIRIDGVNSSKLKVDTYHKDYVYALNLTVRKILSLFLSKDTDCIAYMQGDEASIIINPIDEDRVSEFLIKNHRDKMKIVSAISSKVALIFNSIYRKKELEFDIKVFNIPYSQVQTYLILRQSSGINYSVQYFGKKHVSLEKRVYKTNAEIKERLKEKGIIWEELDSYKKYGLILNAFSIMEPNRFNYNKDIRTLKEIYENYSIKPFSIANYR